jgi:hypothetical protein
MPIVLELPEMRVGVAPDNTALRTTGSTRSRGRRGEFLWWYRRGRVRA